MKKIVILGSTGAIGSSLLNIIKKNKSKFKIELLTANKNYKKLIKQLAIFKVKNIIITDEKAYIKIKKILKKTNVNVYQNFDSIKKIFKNTKIDYVMSAISGFEGLKPTLDIIEFTKTIAIANKESIICGWNLINKKINKHKTKFIPVDSEHFSIWSLTKNVKNKNIEKIYITASGGPFRKLPINQFKKITPRKALKHPNWTMGKKISIDSATMMNKVFEVIEAKKIFDLKYNQLKILIHPQSYLHAIVKFNNGLTKLLVHDTNMTIPIFNSIYPDYENNIKSDLLNINILNNLNLESIDKNRFPVIKIINKLTNNDSLYETVIVSANDALVNNFLKNKIRYNDISKILLKTLNLQEFKKLKKVSPKNIEEVSKLANYVSLKVSIMRI